MQPQLGRYFELQRCLKIKSKNKNTVIIFFFTLTA